MPAGVEVEGVVAMKGLLRIEQYLVGFLGPTPRPGAPGADFHVLVGLALGDE